MSEPLFRNSAVDWSTWAAHQEPRVCESCGTRFQPNHPRRLFCGGPECAGRRPADAQPRKRRPSGHQQAAARAAGVQGFVADVILEVHRGHQRPTGSIDDMLAALKVAVDAEKRGANQLARAAITRLCAHAAVRAIALVPPVLDDEDDDLDDGDEAATVALLTDLGLADRAAA